MIEEIQDPKKMSKLINLDIYAIGLCKEIPCSIVIRQNDSIKDFRFDLPIKTEFHPPNTFSKIAIENNIFFDSQSYLKTKIKEYHTHSCVSSGKGKKF